MKQILVSVFAIFVIALNGCSMNKPAPKPAEPQISPGVTLDGAQVGNLAANELETMLNKMASEQYIPPVNASFDENGTIVPERKGRRLNTAPVKEQLMSAPPGSHITAVYQDILPQITADDLKSAKLAGSYETMVTDNPDRTHNIKLTAKLISNSVIEPGHEFSFNSVTGEPTAERGFRKATVFTDRGHQEQGIGGGMCQVSSTLYNAVLAAGLPVTERHPHSQPVDYVPVNRDATTYTDKDFRFINNTRRYVIIRSYIAGRTLKVDLLTLRR